MLKRTNYIFFNRKMTNKITKKSCFKGRVRGIKKEKKKRRIRGNFIIKKKKREQVEFGIE